MKKSLYVISIAAVLLSATAAVSGAPAQAVPGMEQTCGGPGQPQCAAADPALKCAFTAFATLRPCNWLGQEVPVGTPGSLNG
ncbi:hypothetical protein [Mycolicibacter kumamotonensis]|uniref:hypothetical protein n=1 Tax=Mycolicibacter kumamotonensis TaxID=354243 RepID=UPI0013F4C25C|nr:hypothetical protein [Mycolicibacter kumamotonensis]